MRELTEIQKFNKRLKMLESERSTFIPTWRELSDYHLAHRGRFLSSDRNKGYKRNTRQFNNTSRLASRTLASGMMSGITSPARPWFRLGTPDPDMAEFMPVREWLHKVQVIMYKVFAQSNTYNSLHQLYGELGVFGTGSMGVYSDFKNIIHCSPYTIGSYSLGLNGKNEVDTHYREYDWSVGQVVKQFGYENCSQQTKKSWDDGNTERWVTIIHAVEPNDDRDHMSLLASDMLFRSVYYERGASNREAHKLLRKSGFEEFPIVAPRWDVTGADIYATDCPGMTAIGDTKALQLGERRAYQALDKLVDPPLQGPSSMKSKVGKSLRNGEIVWNNTSGDGLKPVYNFRPDLNAMVSMNREVEGRVQRAFYEDLFLMLANTDRREITAREVSEKHEEKLLMLGPVLERLHTELLDPLIDITFNKLQKIGVLPPAPRELDNVNLRVDYVSVLAQAQRMVSVGAIEHLGNYVGQLSQIWPEARHKFDALQSVDEMAEALGTTPKVVRSDDAVADLSAQDAKQQRLQQAVASGQVLADTAKTASEIDVDPDSAAGKMMEQAGLK